MLKLHMPGIYKSLRTLLQALKSGQVSVPQVVEHYYSVIQENEPNINALITIVPKQKALEVAKQQQKQLEQAKKAGKLTELFNQSPLLGVPVIHKDMFVTKGIRTTAGSKVLDNFVPEYDSTVSEKLKKAGAITIAKANQDAWAHGSSGENSDYGPTRNPWDLERVPGGSSSGSAAAAALRYAPIVTGTDTGGSIRQPASFCGVVGLKPTYGRVSRFGIVAMASSLDSIGHFTQDVWSAAYVLGITAGKDPRDATTADIKVPNYTAVVEEAENIKTPLKGMKIGVLKEFFDDGVDPRIKDVVGAVVKELEKFGATLVDVSIPEVKYGLEIYYIIQPAEVASNLARYDGVRYGNPREYFGPEAKRRIMLGNFILSDVVVGKPEATSYTQAAKARALMIKKFNEAYKKVDVLVGPVSPIMPFKLGEKVDDPLQMYMSDLLTVSINIVGNPGLALNAGWVDNLPVGVQIIAPNFEEARLFRVGRVIEMISGGLP